jgi:hypothetical protein
MSATIGTTIFSVTGSTVGSRYPRRLVWDELETRWEVIPSDQDGPEWIHKRQVLTLTCHVDIDVGSATSPAYRNFINQEQIVDPVISFPRSGVGRRGNVQKGIRNIKYVGTWDILSNKAARTSGTMARITMTIQKKIAWLRERDVTAT